MTDPVPILISIKPIYAGAILDGRKSVEFRKATFPKALGTTVIYATGPVRRMVGIAKVVAVVVLGPEGAWRRYHNCGAIERRAFNAYYAGSKKAVCLEIGEARRLDTPIDPHQIIEDFRAPQSFRYGVCRGTAPGQPARNRKQRNERRALQ